MNGSKADSLLHQLVEGGLIAAQPAAQPLPAGNADRRDHAWRTSWRVGLPDGRLARVTVGPDLADLNVRHQAFARACPGLAPAPVFYQPLDQGEAFAEEFFPGEALELAAGRAPARAQAAFAEVCGALAARVKPSSEPARLAEWQRWIAAVEALDFWTQAEKQLLANLVWPRLYPQLSVAAPAARWTNGDFTSANILVDPSGAARLIDFEFARETHFFVEDAVRFHVLSPVARARPELFAGILPLPGPVWHLFFWLRQLALEAAGNTAAYLARMLPARLAGIRRLAEQTLGCELSGWRVGPAPVHFRVEAARWEQTTATALRVAGWCWVPATGAPGAIVVSRGDRVLATGAMAARPDVQAHFAGEPSARSVGFSVAIPLEDPAVSLAVSVLAGDGTLCPFHAFAACDLPGRGPWVEDYTRWAELHDPDPNPAAPAPAGPLFSILLPVFNTPPAFLRACLDSVRRQHYPHWELCVVDDGSAGGEVPALLREYAAADRRIRVRHRAANGGISRATNDALGAARGEFIVLLDHDDVLRPHALAQFATRLQQEPGLDAVYSDEDKITAEGVRVESFLKPDYSPEFLLGVMYIGHALCVRTAMARAAGGFDPAYDGLQDYEFFLRVTEKTRRIGHVSRMLYHWRQSPGSSALHANVKGNIDEKQAAAVRAHLRRRGRTDTVAAGGHHRVRLLAGASPAVETVLLQGNEDPVAALRRAVATTRAEVIVLLGEPPHWANEGWERELANVAGQPDSGLVAPLLLSREGRVLESGWTVGPDGPVPLMRGFDPAGDGYIGSLGCTREVAMVSPACCALQRQLALATLATVPAGETWQQFCRRLRERGHYHRVCPAARVQLAGASCAALGRGAAASAPDPFFNPHFDRRRADYSLARPPGHLAALRWHLDPPPAQPLRGGGLRLSGWCFAIRGGPVRGIRLRLGDLMIFGVVGLPRPDVKAALPEAPSVGTGFVIRATLPAGRHTVSLEALLPDGIASAMVTFPVEIRRPFIPRWLGGGEGTELIAQQMPLHAIHAPRRIREEKFPAPAVTFASRPKVSMVTPSFQQASFLEETMRSVLDQPDVNLEYVVQDGGSTDGSVGVIQRHGSRLAAWESTADHGQADAIRRGFARTSGTADDLMGWLNADDFFLPGALAFVADYFAQHPELDVLYGHRLLVDEQAREIGRWFLPRHDDEVLRINDFVPQESLFWRRRIWDKVGGLDASFGFAMDWDLLLRFQAAGAKFARVPYFLAGFRIHPAQKTAAAMHDTGQKEIDLLRERSHGRPMAPGELENDPRCVRYLRRSAFLAFAWNWGVRLP